MKLVSMLHNFQALILAASLANTIVAEPLEECSLAYRYKIAADIPCGVQDAVNVCLSDLSESQVMLQSCLVHAGCTVHDAEAEAARAAERCRTNPEREAGNIELRHLGGLHALHAIRDVVAIRAAQNDNDDNNGTEESNAATTAAPSTTNTWVMVQHLTGTTYTTVTCMTPTTVATSACSYINDAEETTCVPTNVVIPTCVPGKTCAFDQTNGAVRCAQKGGMGTGGIIVGSVLGVAVAIAVGTLCLMCCRERSQRRKDRRTAEAALAAAKKPSHSVISMSGPGGYAPLMEGGRDGPEPSDHANPFRGGQQYHDSR